MIRIAIVFVLHEVEDVEALQRSLREEAVHRILLVVEELKGDSQLGPENETLRPAVNARTAKEGCCSAKRSADEFLYQMTADELLRDKVMRLCSRV